MHPKLEKTMKVKMIRKALLVLVLGTIGQFAFAQADAAKTIADIVASVNHFPSAEQKATLEAISQNSANSAAIQTIAKAVHDMQHSATGEHKAMLETIAADASATSAEKELAAIAAGFTHMANDETKARLAAVQ
jgi:hypothetical protein